jgi:hypothetical protein
MAFRKMNDVCAVQTPYEESSGLPRAKPPREVKIGDPHSLFSAWVALRLRNAVLDFTVVAVPPGSMSGRRDEVDHAEQRAFGFGQRYKPTQERKSSF